VNRRSALWKVFTSTAPARNIVQALAYRCLPSPKFKKNISWQCQESHTWHISYYFLIFSEILSVSSISCSLVVRWGYQHSILAVEAKNSAKVTLLNFNAPAVFPRHVMASENDVLEAGSALDVFAWLTLRSHCKFELQVK